MSVEGKTSVDPFVGPYILFKCMRSINKLLIQYHLLVIIHYDLNIINHDICICLVDG